jgi:hypothetical protein
MEREIHLPGMKADVEDSLHFLLDINFQLEKLKENKITQEEFAQYVLKRSSEVTYISTSKHTFAVIQDTKELFKSLMQIQTVVKVTESM